MRAVLTLHSPALAKAYYEGGQWRSDTFYSLLARNAAAQPDATAMIDADGALNWSEVLGRVDALAAQLEAMGLASGDRVSIWMSDRVETIIAFLACARLGLACNPSLHKTYRCQEIVALLDRLGSSVLITEDGWGIDRAQVDFKAMLGELIALKAVLSPAEFPAPGATPLSKPQTDADALAYLAFTSGTTGAPKCVMHSANTLLSNARDLVAAWEIDAETRLLTLSPLSHHIGWVAAGQWLLSGCTLIVGPPPRGHKPLDWIIETRATYVMGVPTHAMDILADQKARGLPRIGTVSIFYMAGAPIPEVVAEAFVSQGIRPQNVYGMTENSSHQFTHPDDSAATWTATCGRGGPGYTVKIVNAENPDIDVAAGQVGQIAGRGANLMLGYFANQAATEGSFNSDGWFLSGDLGAMDAEGNLTIEGRLKDLIIRGGHNIYPAQIEATALRHPDIEKAAAFPVPDERLGEKVCLAVEGAISAEAVLAHLAAQGLSKADMPEWFVTVDAFPLTPSGKILKRDLVDMHRAGQIAPTPVRYREKTGA
ncbi:MAG: class I adenylate-forming enzyme family protein [Pseudomonadota bacterium]